MPLDYRHAEEKEAEPDLDKFRTTSQVAELYGCKAVDIQRCIKKGLVKAQRVGYFYLIWEPGLPETLPVRQSESAA